MNETPKDPKDSIEYVRREPEASTEETLDFMRRMQEAGKGYDGTEEAKARVRDHLSKWSKEELRRYARRVMVDLMGDKPPAQADPQDQSGTAAPSAPAPGPTDPPAPSKP
jgi:hypothetical protein